MSDSFHWGHVLSIEDFIIIDIFRLQKCSIGPNLILPLIAFVRHYLWNCVLAMFLVILILTYRMQIAVFVLTYPYSAVPARIYVYVIRLTDDSFHFVVHESSFL